MKKEINKDKTDIITLLLNTVENDSRSKEAAKEFLASENLGVDNIISNGLLRIKRMQMEIEARKTEKEMLDADTYKKQAEEWVEKLLAEFDFSLPAIIEREKLSVSFRNVESLDPKDIKNILIKHFTLKLMGKHNEGK